MVRKITLVVEVESTEDVTEEQFTSDVDWVARNLPGDITYTCKRFGRKVRIVGCKTSSSGV